MRRIFSQTTKQISNHEASNKKIFKQKLLTIPSLYGQYYVFNHGTWIELCVWKKQDEDIDKTMNETVLFKKIDNIIWHKLVNGVLVKEFEFVQTEKNEVILYDSSEIRERSFLKLNSHEALNGSSKDECTIVVCKGDWLID